MMNGTCVQAVSFGVGEAEGAGVEVADCPAMSFVFVCWHITKNKYQKYKSVQLGDQLP